MRPPSVFVRSLTVEEGQRLKRLSRSGKHQMTRQRAAIVLASATLMSAPEIARAWRTDESHVRGVIRDFNQRGMDSLFPNWRGGRPRRITAAQRTRIVAVAGARPAEQGISLSRWSLPRLARFLAGEGIRISPAHTARILAAAGVSFQRSRSWKASPDPDYEAKAARVLALYAQPPADGGVVVSFDEMGPISLRPHQGSGWAPTRRPQRVRATYHRRHGTRYIIAALDVHGDRLRARLQDGRNGASTLVFMQMIRRAYPTRRRLYWIQDNLSCHWTPAIRAWAEDHNVELVPTPTYASYLNRIESHFRPVQEFVFNNTDYVNWDAARYALGRYLLDRNDTRHRDPRVDAIVRRHQVTAA